jgi:hypothetical protein
MRRREFLTGVAGAAVLPIPGGGAFRFLFALRKAIRIKRRNGELGVALGEKFEFALNRRVLFNGRRVTVANHVRDEVKPPWWRNALDWILENWQVILKVLLTLVALI